ncbi:MAG TPA: GYF domain-containing protein [Pirellulaceae bacterium]|jgi:hypothetical protein|nr:GYF domain-containing protein [Pirellulaceae bacterium]
MEDLTQYFVRRRGRTEGPWPLSKLKSEVALRKLGRFDDVSSDGMTWQRAGEVDGLFVSESRRASTPVSPAASSAPVGSTDEDMRLTPEPAPASAATYDRAPQQDGWEWFWCVDDDPHVGPFGTDALRQAFLSGNCPRQALVWREGFADWQTPAAVAEFRDLFAAGPSDRTAYGDAPAPLGNSLAAIFAIVIGIGSLLLSVLPLAGAFGVVAIGLGVYAVREIRGSHGELTGFGLAITGVVTGSIAALAGAVWMVLLIYAVVVPEL